MVKRLRKSELTAKIFLKGMGISFVDSEPKEVLYISVYKIIIDYKQETEAVEDGTLDEVSLDLRIYHMQIDNQIPSNNPNKIIFAPMEELNFEALADEEVYTPFVQVKLNTEELNDGVSIMKKFPGFVV
jgi:hypothetical protein